MPCEAFYNWRRKVNVDKLDRFVAGDEDVSASDITVSETRHRHPCATRSYGHGNPRGKIGPRCNSCENGRMTDEARESWYSSGNDAESIVGILIDHSPSSVLFEQHVEGR